MIKMLIILTFIYILISALTISVLDHHDECYSEMEDAGNAVFGCCKGLTGGTRHTGYLQESCVDCPYLVLFDKKGENR